MRRSSRSRIFASASALARAERSSSVSVRSTTPELPRAGFGGGAGRGIGALTRARLADHRLRCVRCIACGRIAADAALAPLFDHDLLGAAMAEALAHGALLDARLERQGLGRDTQCLVARRFRINHSAVLILLRCACPHSLYRQLPGRIAGYLAVVRHPVSNQDLAARQECLARRACEQRSMYHI